jgi:hypothetical protein
VLNQRGAGADLRGCGAGRVCVRVDLSALRYGESSDYIVIKGYLSGQAQKFSVDDQRELKSKRNAEHQEEGKIRRPEELPEQRRENAKQGERTQHQGDDWLEDEKKEERWQPDALPDNPGRICQDRLRWLACPQ